MFKPFLLLHMVLLLVPSYIYMWSMVLLKETSISLLALAMYMVGMFLLWCVIVVLLPYYVMYRERVKRFHLLMKEKFWRSPLQDKSLIDYQLYHSPIAEHSILAMTSVWGRKLYLVVGRQDRQRYSQEYLEELSHQFLSLLDRFNLRKRQFVLSVVGIYLITILPLKILPRRLYYFFRPIFLAPVYQVMEYLVSDLPLIPPEEIRDEQASLIKKYLITEEAHSVRKKDFSFTALLALGLRITDFDYMRRFRLNRVEGVR